MMSVCRRLCVCVGVIFMGVAAGGQAVSPFVVQGVYVPTTAGSNGSSSPGAVVASGSLGYFSAFDAVNGRELWITDGTTNGTRLVRDIRPGSADSNPMNITAFAGGVVFTADDGLLGRELWFSDGSATGTRMIDDVRPGGLSSSPYGLVVAGGTLFANVSLETEAVLSYNGQTIEILFSSAACCLQDGSCVVSSYADCAGRRGLYAGQNTTCAAFCNQLVSVSCRLSNSVCVYRDAAQCLAAGGTPNPPGRACQPHLASQPRACCTADGSCTVVESAQCIDLQGLFRPLALSCEPSPCGPPIGACCFQSGGCAVLHRIADCDSSFGVPALGEVCANGFLDGCVSPNMPCCLRDGSCVVIRPEACNSLRGWIRPLESVCSAAACFVPSSSAIRGPGVAFEMAAQAYLLALSATGTAIYSTNGSFAGTVPVAHVGPGLWVSDSPPVVLGSRALFAYNDDVHGAELWSFDGADASLVVDIEPGPGSGFDSGVPIVVSGTQAYFVAGAAGSRQLWASDGTAGGTRQISAIPGFEVDPADLVPTSVGIMFTAVTPSLGRIWHFADAVGSVTAVGPIGGGGTGTSPVNHRIALGNTVLYSQRQPGAGLHLWSVSNVPGSAARVFPSGSAAEPLQQDVNPTGLSLLGGRVLFGAQFFAGDAASQTGRELWSTNGLPGQTSLVKDINTTQVTPQVTMAAGTGSRLFFSAPDPASGYELFATDGTPASTTLIKDTLPGPNHGNPSNFALAGNRLLFSAQSDPGSPRRLLWFSDGTPAGTSLFGTTSSLVGSSASAMVVTNGSAFYFDRTAAAGYSLWAANQALGQRLLFDPTPGANTQGNDNLGDVLGVHANLVFFSANDGIYRTDGSVAGTLRVVSWTPNQGRRLINVVSTPSGAVLVGSGIWLSDGTPSGTSLLVSGDSVPFTGIWHTWSNGMLFFVGRSSTSNQRSSLWRTDLTVGGLLELFTFTTTVAQDAPAESLSTSDTGVFFYLPGTGTLYHSDGTVLGTAPFALPGITASSILVVGQVGAEQVLAVNVGTVRNLYSFLPGSASATDLTPGQFIESFPVTNVAGPGNPLYFFSNSPRNLWKTNASAAGTQRLDIPQPALSERLQRDGDSVVFLGTTSAAGKEFFRNSVASTAITLAYETVPGPMHANPRSFVSGGGSHFFVADTPASGPQVHQFASDFSAATVVSAANANPPAIDVFAIYPGPAFTLVQSQAAVYRSDGTSSGTRRIVSTPMSSVPGAAAFIGNLGVFAATDALRGPELWVTDGTDSGTSIIVDLVPGPTGSAPANLRALAGLVYCEAQLLVGVAPATSVERVPLATDGSPSGTRVLVHTALPISEIPRNPSDFAATSSNVVFVADGPLGRELYITDGSPNSAQLLLDIAPGPASSQPQELVSVAGLVFFSAWEPVAGREFWSTDGTAAGTRRVRDLFPGPFSSAPTSLRAVGDRVLFVASTPETGAELWSSDGSAAGTLLLFEVNPGPSSGSISDLTVAPQRVYFVATQPPLSTSIWSYDWIAGRLAAGCVGDYNRDGSATIEDVFVFLADWFTFATRADITGNGDISVQDIFAFLEGWFAGCGS